MGLFDSIGDFFGGIPDAIGGALGGVLGSGPALSSEASNALDAIQQVPLLSEMTAQTIPTPNSDDGGGIFGGLNDLFGGNLGGALITGLGAAAPLLNNSGQEFEDTLALQNDAQAFALEKLKLQAELEKQRIRASSGAAGAAAAAQKEIAKRRELTNAFTNAINANNQGAQNQQQALQFLAGLLGGRGGA